SPIFALPPPPRSTLFPYTTLFRSARTDRVETGASRDIRVDVDGVGAADDARAGEVDRRGGRARRVADRGTDRNRGALARQRTTVDRKSTRLNSSHVEISYAVFCLK